MQLHVYVHVVTLCNNYIPPPTLGSIANHVSASHTQKAAHACDGGKSSTSSLHSTLPLSCQVFKVPSYTRSLHYSKSTKVQTLGAVALHATTDCTDEASIIGSLNWAIV